MRRLFLALGLLVASCQPVMAAGVGLTALTPHGAVAATDLVPCQPAAGTTLLSCKASDLGSPAITFKTYGAVGDGTTDDTVAIQAAINAGIPVGCTGVYKTTATLTFNTTASEGLGINGSGPLGLDGVANANRCVIKPSAAVTVAFNIDGVSRGGYVNGLEINNLTLDMTNMAAGSKGFLQGQTFDIKYRNVRVMGDTSKYAWYMGPGAFVTHLDTIQGHTVSCTGNGTQNPTTLLISNPDILELDASQCANVTTIGGAIQFRYNSGVTPILWVASGNTDALGFYDTVADFNTANGTTGGIYYAIGSTFDNMNNLQSLGTDWEALDNPGSACTPLTGGGTWTAGTHNDGTHGCHPMIWVPKITSTVRGCEFHTPVFGSEYLYSPQTNGCTISGAKMPGNTSKNIHNTLDVFNAGGYLNKGQALIGYTGNETGQSIVLDASTGGIISRALSLVPTVNGQNMTLENAAAVAYMICSSSATISASGCQVGSGADWRGFSDTGFSIQTYDFDASTGNGTFTGTLSAANVSASGQMGMATLAVQPAVDGTNFISYFSHGGTQIGGMYSSATPSLASVFWDSGANMNWYSDNGSTLKATIAGSTGNASFGTISGSAIAASTSILSTGSGGIGYAVGAGGAVTQATSRTTGVTLNKTTGAITLVSAAGLATYQTFTVTDSAVAATDTVVLSQKSGTDKYILLPTAIAAGSFAITFATTGGTTTEQPVLNFTVIKGAAS